MQRDEMSAENKMMWRMKHREHNAVRLLAAVIVLVFVFWCGFEFGEIRASVGQMMYGHEMMYGGWGPGTVTPIYNTTTTMRTGAPVPAAGTSVSGGSVSGSAGIQ